MQFEYEISTPHFPRRETCKNLAGVSQDQFNVYVNENKLCHEMWRR
jgi:hypothetical protein